MRDDDFINRGIYSLPQAARLLRLQPQTLRSWVSERSKNPITSGGLPIIGKTEFISFAALIELLVVCRLRESKVSLQHLRKVLDRLREKFGDPHPFALNLVLYTDQRHRVFWETVKNYGDNELINIAENQFEMKEVIKRSLSKGLSFSGDTELVSCWQPDEKQCIENRPDIAFGSPVVSGTGIKTYVLRDSFMGECDAGQTEEDAISTVANWYEIDPSAVRDAILFENTYAA